MTYRPPPPRGRAPEVDPDADDFDTIPEADRALFASRCLLQYAMGKTPETIAFEEGVNHWTVWRVIREAADGAQQANRELAENAFIRQSRGLDHLIMRCMESIERHARMDPPVLDRDTVRVLVTIYERQAKLLGLDRSRLPGDKESGEWLRNASDADLVKRAKSLGIRLPESIVPTDD